MHLYKCTIALFALVVMIGCGSSKIQEEVTINPNLHNAPVKVPEKIISSNILAKDRVLVFSKTNGFRHKSIEKGVATFVKLGVANNFAV
ncbi:MAG: hypothetical protein RIM68_14890, partial [Arenibacter sp.]